jgi:hypothetical protein
LDVSSTPAYATGPAYRAYLAASQRCAEAFRPRVRPVFNVWIHPTTGERRRYITNVAEIIGFTYEGYGLKVHAGVLDGEPLSNNQTYKLVELIGLCKFWVDDQRVLHYRNVAGTSSRLHTPKSLADAINATRTR